MHVELMMVDGMDPNEACAIALREAPTVLANSVSHDSPVPILSAGMGENTIGKLNCWVILKSNFERGFRAHFQLY